MDDEIKICGTNPHPRFKKLGLSPCIHEPGHEGGHIYYLHIRQGMDHRTCAGEFFLELNRTTLKPDIHIDLRGQQGLTNEEAAAVYAWLLMRRKAVRG